MWNKMTKKAVLVLMALAAVLAMAGCGGGDKKDAKPAADSGKKLTVAINATFPPFESVKAGTKDYTGIDIEIAQYIGKKMGRQVEFSDMKFASLVPTLQSKRADMIVSGISPTKERQQVLSFSKPYYFPMKALVFRKEDNFKSLADLKGKKAGASMGTTYCEELKKAGGIQVAELDSTPLVVQDVKNKRLDAGLFDSAQAAVFVKENPELKLAVLDSPVVMDDTFAVALPKDSKDVETVNKILKEMKANGELHKILVKYLGEEATKQYEAQEAKLDIAKWLTAK
ncbi:MAG: transporter substrate-binding domain-containing protein [Succiniclasticum sp.]|jgi:polar amino acid transport system substrate-binding protein|nr:transporter substrate-binding domain-containing protein [Succiniclasticum sp.]MEE3479554.1 transporter substrate-binding domain-containing protein [Succiniclasticum sp.]